VPHDAVNILRGDAVQAIVQRPDDRRRLSFKLMELLNFGVSDEFTGYWFACEYHILTEILNLPPLGPRDFQCDARPGLNPEHFPSSNRPAELFRVNPTHSVLVEREN
jgi:hypothetical protein